MSFISPDSHLLNPTHSPPIDAAIDYLGAFDPEGMKEAQRFLKNVTYCSDAYDCMTGANAAVVLTEWNQFRALDIAKTEELLKDKVFVDLRNIYQKDELEGSSLKYSSIGRP